MSSFSKYKVAESFSDIRHIEMNMSATVRCVMCFHLSQGQDTVLCSLYLKVMHLSIVVWVDEMFVGTVHEDIVEDTHRQMVKPFDRKISAQMSERRRSCLLMSGPYPRHLLL